MGRFHSAGWALATAACWLISTHDAKADFASDAVSIIEQVVEDDIATQVVPNGAADFPVTCDLFPASVYALQAKRFNGFPSLVRKDVADATGLLVFIAVEDDDLTKLPPVPGAVAGTTFSFRQQTRDVLAKLLHHPLAPSTSYTNPAACSFDNSAAAASVAPRQSLSSSVLQACASTQATASQEIACSVALGVRDGANGDEKLVPSDGKRALVALAAQAVMRLDPVAFGDAVTLVTQAVGSPTTPVIPPAGATVDAPTQALLQSLGAQIAAVSNASSQTVEQLLGMVATFGAQALSGYSPSPSPLAKELRTVSALATGVYEIVTDIQAKNYGAAASDSFDAIDEVIACPEDDQSAGPCTHVNKLVVNFLKATAVYSVDSVTAGNVDASVSSDFRAAAVDLIEATGGAGIRRKTFVATSGQHPGWYFPNIALREALRPGFAGPVTPGANPNVLLTYASMDWPNLRFKIYPAKRATNPLWVGGNISVTDLIGPLVELAARNSSLSSDKSRGDAFGLGFFVPRLEFEFGIPELTKNLVVGLGTTFRLYRAVQSIPTSTTTPVTASYCFVGSSSCRDGTFNAGNFEGSVFVKYVP